MKETIKSRVYVLNDFLQIGYNESKLEDITEKYETTLNLENWRTCCFLDLMRIQKGETVYTYADNLPRIDLQQMSLVVYNNYNRFIPDSNEHGVFEFASNSVWYKSAKILSIIALVSFENEKMKEAIGEHIFSASIYIITDGLEVTFLKDHLRIYLKPNGLCGFMTNGDKEWIKDHQNFAEILYAVCGNVLSTIMSSSCKNTSKFHHSAPRKLNAKRRKKGLAPFNNFKSLKMGKLDLSENIQKTENKRFILKARDEKIGDFILETK